MKKSILMCIIIFILLSSVVSCDVKEMPENDRQTTREDVKENLETDGQTKGEDVKDNLKTDGQTKGEDVKDNLETDEQTMGENNDAYTEGDIDISVDPIFWILTDIDEYREYVSKHEMPKDFISYDKLSSIGEFSWLTFRASHFDYHYELIDKNGFIIVMYVSLLEPGEDLISGDVSGREVLRPDKLETEKIVFNTEFAEKIVLCNDIKYIYDRDGRLRYVSFIAGRYMITFEAGSVYNEKEGKYDRMSFADYKPAVENALTVLLSGNEDNVSLEAMLGGTITD